MLRYFDYVFTGVFTFEMLIKVTKYHCANVDVDVCGYYISLPLFLLICKEILFVFVNIFLYSKMRNLRV